MSVIYEVPKEFRGQSLAAACERLRTGHAALVGKLGEVATEVIRYKGGDFDSNNLYAVGTEPGTKTITASNKKNYEELRRAWLEDYSALSAVEVILHPATAHYHPGLGVTHYGRSQNTTLAAPCRQTARALEAADKPFRK